MIYLRWSLRPEAWQALPLSSLPGEISVLFLLPIFAYQSRCHQSLHVFWEVLPIKNSVPTIDSLNLESQMFTNCFIIIKCISSSKLIPYFRPSFLGACKGVFQCFNFSSQSQNRRFACIRFWWGYLPHRRCNTYSFTCICCMIDGSIRWYWTGCSPYCRRRRRSGRSRRWDHRQFRSSTMMSRRWRWGVWSYWWILLIWWCSRSPSWKFLFWFSWWRRSWWKSVTNSSAAVIWLEWFVQMKMNRMWRRRDIDSCICNIFIWYILKGENLYIIGVVLYSVITYISKAIVQHYIWY